MKQLNQVILVLYVIVDQGMWAKAHAWLITELLHIAKHIGIKPIVLRRAIHEKFLPHINTVWRETLAVGKFGEFSGKTYLAKENLTKFVHSQNKNYKNYVCYPA